MHRSRRIKRLLRAGCAIRSLTAAFEMLSLCAKATKARRSSNIRGVCISLIGGLLVTEKTNGPDHQKLNATHVVKLPYVHQFTCFQKKCALDIGWRRYPEYGACHEPPHGTLLRRLNPPGQAARSQSKVQQHLCRQCNRRKVQHQRGQAGGVQMWQ